MFGFLGQGVRGTIAVIFFQTRSAVFAVTKIQLPDCAKIGKCGGVRMGGVD